MTTSDPVGLGLKELRHHYRKLAKYFKEGRLLTVENIAEACVRLIVCRVTIHCICTTSSSSSLVPSLSLSIIDGNTLYYSNVDELKKTLTVSGCFPPEQSAVDHYSFHTANYTILFRLPTGRQRVDEETQLACAVVGKICETVRKASLQIRNAERDILTERYDDLTVAFRSKSNYSLTDLCSFIRNCEDLSVLILHVKTSSGHKFEYAVDDLHANKHRLAKSILDTSSPEYRKRVKGLFAEAIRTGKTISGYVRDVIDFPTFFVIVPVARKVSTQVRQNRILLVYKNEPISSRTIDHVLDYIDLFLSDRMAANRLNEMISVQQRILAIPETLSTNKLIAYQEFEEPFRRFAASRLDQILSTTHAFSAVVRLYDPELNELTIFEEACDADGYRDTNRSHPYHAISLRLHRTSVNAFTFLDGGKKYDWVYINTFGSPVPKQYRESGLESSWMVRENARSEICFPLISGQLPFGVLNIESPLRGAFDDDIPYLLAEKRSIEAFYDRLIHASDVVWLRSHIIRYENIHEIKNYADHGFFNKETTDILARLLWSEAEARRTPDKKEDSISLGALKVNLEDWTYRMHSDLSEENITKIQSTLAFNFPHSMTVSLELFESVEVILKNLVQNVVRWGDPERDKITISVQHFYEIKDPGVIRVRMRTYGKITGDILERIGISPIKDKAGSLHFGLFLVGMLTRALGGVLYVSRQVNVPSHIIDVRIPLKGVKEIEQTQRSDS